MISTQQFVPIENIDNDLVFLKDGSATLVISTSAVNFGLLFETEQIAIIDAFAGFLNSLSYPIQIVIRSQRMDVHNYLEVIDNALEKQTNPLLKTMTAKYREFVESMIKENNVLDKQFYICLHIAGTEMGVFAGHGDDKVKKAVTILRPRADHLLRQLSRIGLKARQLTTPELVKLYYEIYNPIRQEPTVTVVNKSEKEAPKPKHDLLSKFKATGEVKINPPENQPPAADNPSQLSPSAAAPPAVSPTPANLSQAPQTYNQAPNTGYIPPFVVEELTEDVQP